MESFINNISYQCLLGPQSKEVEIIGNIARWRVGKKRHFTNLDLFTSNDISNLKNYNKYNFHYLSLENIDILKQNGFIVDKSKLKSTCIKLDNLKYIGRKYHGIRGAINKNKKRNFIIQDNFNDLSDVKEMLEIWSNDIGAKYFRDFSGKNYYFFKNNFHLGCNNIFIYDQGKLVSFGILSAGEYSSYIIGKALFNKYPGLSEYTDILAYDKAYLTGTKAVNLGQSKGNISIYKDKFPNTYSVIHYDGSVEL